MRVCGYVRVSSNDQIEGFSLAAQRHAIEVFAAAHGWEIARWYEDAGVSAHADAIEKRPAFAAMLAAAEAGRFDRLVCHKLDRFSRRLTVTLDALARLDRAGVGFISISENLDFASPIGKVALAMLGALAQYHSDNISVEIKKGLAEKRRQGFRLGHPPYGARRVDGHFVIDPDRADDLRLVLELIASLPPTRAADELNRRGVPPPRRATAWGVTAFRATRGEAGAWLLEQGEPWADLYRAARRHAPPSVKRTETVRMLTGLVRCVCGNPVSYHSTAILRDGHERRYGDCRDATGRRRGCKRWGRTLDQVEAAVTRWLFALPDPRRAVALPDDRAAAAALDARRRRIARLYRDGLIGDTEYERERTALLRDAATLPGVAARAEEIGAGLALVRASWSGLHDEARRAFLAGLVSRFIAEDGEVRPVWRPGIAPLWEELG